MNNLKLLIIFAFFAFSSILIDAQKIGVVDTNYILSKLPQYKEAEARLNQQISSWEGEIQNLQREYDSKKAAFENEKVLLIGDQLKEREKEVIDLDKKLKNTINTRFGSNGEINGARANLAKPFQDQIWNAINTVVEKNTLGIVLDKSNNISVLFLDNRYDYTDKVLDILLKDSPKKVEEKSNSNASSRKQGLENVKNKKKQPTTRGGK